MSRAHRLQRDPRTGNYYCQLQRHGVRKYFQFGSNRREAEKQMLELSHAVAKDRLSFTNPTSAIVKVDGTKDIRVEELAVKHLEWVKANRTEGTFQNRQLYVIRFLKFVGPVMVSDITRMQLESFHAYEKQTYGRGPNSGNEALASVKAMLRWGEEMEICTLAFRKFPTLVFTPPLLKRAQDTDLAILLANAPDDFRDMLVFGLLTGLRPKELRELTQSQILHNQKGVAFVEIQRHKTSRTARTPRPRSVPLSPEAERIVDRQVMQHPQSPFIFLNGDGTPYAEDGFKKRLQRLCKHLGLPSISPYALRHTFASVQSDAGTESTALSHLMGHSTTRTLERYVSNTLESHQRAVSEGEKYLLETVMKSGAGMQGRVESPVETPVGQSAVGVWHKEKGP